MNGAPFRQCAFLLLHFTPETLRVVDDADSIDEAEQRYLESVGSAGIEERKAFEKRAMELEWQLTSEERFLAHASNIQAWVELGYDTRLLHRNLAFPLLKKLTEAGDPQAKKVFKEEIAKRYATGHPTVREFLKTEGYLDLLSQEELNSL
ncbi:MAG: hypothetical protein GF383_16030 [Candidatus Lokiarchaeota archaeon]|nr:hypothetical protein [Candidatus Lokiarchaeota archaeon]